MPLNPIDEIHALQIQAGVIGRKAGHEFEDKITKSINTISYPVVYSSDINTHVNIGDPGILLLHYIASYYGESEVISAKALSTGALATSKNGRKWLSINGSNVSRCKSDVVITVIFGSGKTITSGASTKQCNNKTPTNAQLFFTTASGFSSLLRNNGIDVSESAIIGLRKFCGDSGYRPQDNPKKFSSRVVDPRRFFWEEIGEEAINEWKNLFSKFQEKITRLLLQKAYIDDKFVPEFIIHKTRSATAWDKTEVAIYGIDELIALSGKYQGFVLKPYSVKKGSYKDPAGTLHMAPRFGIVQMQRGGQQQHPEQLQFNLESGYFYKIGQHRGNMLSEAKSE